MVHDDTDTDPDPLDKAHGAYTGIDKVPRYYIPPLTGQRPGWLGRLCTCMHRDLSDGLRVMP